nr:ATP-binding protein [Flavobacterium sp. MC2016-06]
MYCCQKKTNNTNTKSNKSQIEKLISEADELYISNKKEKAFIYYNKAKFICDPITDTDNYINVLNSMAKIQQDNKDYAGSESIASEAIPYLKHIKYSKHKWDSYMLLGVNYMNTYDYKDALYYLHEALKLATTDQQKQTVKNNIAFVYMHQSKYIDALQVFLSLAVNISSRESSKDYAVVLDNIGFCYSKIDDSRSLLYLNSALKLRSNINDIHGLGTSYFHLAEFYKNKDIILSKKYAALSYKDFTISNSIDDRLNALELIIKNESGKALKEKAILYTELIDSIFEVRQKAKNQFARIKYDSKKEKEENLKLNTQKIENELQLERQENKNILLYIIIILSLCFILTLYFYLTSRAKRQNIEATYYSETRISKKLHDELANDIYHTMAFVENRNLSTEENREHLLNNLNEIYSRTRDISKENCTITTNKNYAFSLKEMISGFNTSNINLLLNGFDTIVWDEIDKNKKTAVYRVLQELLVNMRKHSNATLVCINFKKTNKSVVINYIDNGKGFDIKNITLKNGLHSVKNRILKIKGDITIDSSPDKGFKVSIKFPL